MIVRLVLALFILLITGAQVLACSCAYDKSISELVEDGSIVVLATPVGSYSGRVYSNGSVHPTRLRIWRTYSGETSSYEDIDSSSNSSCGVTFPQNKKSLIVAWQGNSGLLHTGSCSNGGYTNAEWMAYFETGKDAFSYNGCVLDIMQAYEADGAFKLEREGCRQYIEEYDAYQTARQAPIQLSEQQDCFQKIGENYSIKMITGFQVGLEDAALCEQYIAAYDKAHPTHRKRAEAREPAPNKPEVKAVPKKKFWWKFWK